MLAARPLAGASAGGDGGGTRGDPRVQNIAAAAKDLDDKRRAWLDPPGASPDDHKKRILTTPYDARLDRAVWDAYGWDAPHPATTPAEAILPRLLALNRERAAPDAPNTAQS